MKVGTQGMADLDQNAKPTEDVDLREVFGIDSDMKVKAFATRTDRVPELDPTYKFDHDTTLAILAGFVHNRRVMIQGSHGTGKSTHIEQVAARLNWPCVRVNLDSHVSRIDLVGKDAIVLQDGTQVYGWPKLGSTIFDNSHYFTPALPRDRELGMQRTSGWQNLPSSVVSGKLPDWL